MSPMFVATAPAAASGLIAALPVERAAALPATHGLRALVTAPTSLARMARGE